MTVSILIVDDDERVRTSLSQALGRRLFFDPILSADRRVSCATCHLPERAFADTTAVSIGVRTCSGPAVRRQMVKGHGRYVGSGSVRSDPRYQATIKSLPGGYSPPRREARVRRRRYGMKIEVWSDLVCPWCYIGKRRLERALKEFDDDVEVLWRSFELDPSAPREPQERLDEALAIKYGMTVEEAREMMAHMSETGAEEGLELNFERARGGNTLDAHRLLHYAGERGVQPEMAERLFRAYMTEGRPISHREELASLAADVGLDTQEVLELLDSDEFVDTVRRDEERAHRMGVRGVPFFLLEEKAGIPGAHPSEVLLRALRQVGARSA